MAEPTPKALFEIYAVDRELDRLEREEAALKKSLALKEKALKDLSERVMKLESEAKAVQKDLFGRQTKVKDLAEKIARAEKKQAFVTKVKEAEAAARELSELNEFKENEELEALMIEDRLSPLQAELAKLTAQQKAEDEILQAERKDAAGKLNVIAGLRSGEEAKRAPILDQLTKEVRFHYERLRETNHKDALVPVEEDACKGCQQGLLPNILMHVNAGSLTKCPHCGRFLFKAEASGE